MIDCHIHTKRSHHGIGDIEEVILSAIDKNLEIIGFSEHGPLPFDCENRMNIEETKEYLLEINIMRSKYSSYIKILAGLEMDYSPLHEEFIKNIILSNELDFVYGSVHFIDVNEDKISVWDFEQFKNPVVVNTYFTYLKNAITSNMYTALAHPDIILRAGIKPTQVIDSFLEILQLCKKHNVGYEINCSGLTKDMYDPLTDSKKNHHLGESYPNFDLITLANNLDVKLTLGSDAHEPATIGKNIPLIITELQKRNISEIVYFEQKYVHTVRISV